MTPRPRASGYIYMSSPSISALFLQHILQDQSQHFTICQPRVVHSCSNSASCTSDLVLVSSLVEICLSILITTISMAEEIRYVTLNGQPPNGGVPPGRMFASIVVQAPAINPGHYGPPPPYPAQYQPAIPTVHPQPPYPAQYQPAIPTVYPQPPHPVAPAAPVARASPVQEWDPPGSYVDGCKMQGNGFTMIISREITRFLFLWDGIRPCDYHRGFYPGYFNRMELKAESSMTVGEFIDGLGMPHGDQYAIQELEELGDQRWTSGLTITRGSDHARKTLAEVGWSARRSRDRPIWLMRKS